MPSFIHFFKHGAATRQTHYTFREYGLLVRDGHHRAESAARWCRGLHTYAAWQWLVGCATWGIASFHHIIIAYRLHYDIRSASIQYISKMIFFCAMSTLFTHELVNKIQFSIASLLVLSLTELFFFPRFVVVVVVVMHRVLPRLSK